MVERESVRVLSLLTHTDGSYCSTHMTLRGRDTWELPGGESSQENDSVMQHFRELYETGIGTSRLRPSLAHVQVEFAFGGRCYRQKEEVFPLSHAHVAILPPALEGGPRARRSSGIPLVEARGGAPSECQFLPATAS